MTQLLRRNIMMMWMALLIGMMLNSCEEPFIPNESQAETQYVIEGYIEAGVGANPTYVMITKTFPFLSEIGAETISGLFVNGAEVSVNDGDKTVSLTELCLNDIPEEYRDQISAVLGFDSDSIQTDICIYVDIFDSLSREAGRSYQLDVYIDGHHISAVTTIPEFAGLSDFRWDDSPGIDQDSFAELNVTVNDPAGVQNFYRYLTATGKERTLVPPVFGSVVDDAVFDGKDFEIPLPRTYKRGSRGDDFDPDTYGLFERGDSVFIKWCNLDKAHFDFWNTRDNASSSGGPFSSYTRIISNIDGGIGIWGGYSVELYRLYCPEK